MTSPTANRLISAVEDGRRHIYSVAQRRAWTGAIENLDEAGILSPAASASTLRDAITPGRWPSDYQRSRLLEVIDWLEEHSLITS